MAFSPVFTDGLETLNCGDNCRARGSSQTGRRGCPFVWTQTLAGSTSDFGFYVVRQSAKLKDDLGDSVNGGVDTREAQASARGGKATHAPAFVSILEISATFPPDLTNPDTNLHRHLNI